MSPDELERKVKRIHIRLLIVEWIIVIVVVYAALRFEYQHPELFNMQ